MVDKIFISFMGVMFVLIIVCNIYEEIIWIFNERALFTWKNNLRRFQNCHAEASPAFCSKFIYSQFDECKPCFFLVNFFPFSHKLIYGNFDVSVLEKCFSLNGKQNQKYQTAFDSCNVSKNNRKINWIQEHDRRKTINYCISLSFLSAKKKQIF